MHSVQWNGSVVEHKLYMYEALILTPVTQHKKKGVKNKNETKKQTKILF